MLRPALKPGLRYLNCATHENRDENSMSEAVARGMRELVTWGVIPARNGKKTRNQQCVSPPPQQSSPSLASLCLTDEARQSPLSNSNSNSTVVYLQPQYLYSTGRTRWVPNTPNFYLQSSTTNPIDCDGLQTQWRRLWQPERKSFARDVGGLKVSLPYVQRSVAGEKAT